MFKLWQDPHFRIYAYGLFAIYTLLGLYATAWISDEFDYLRLSLTSYITVPALCVFLACFIEDRHYWRKWPKVFVTSAAIIFVTLFWGHFLMLNALGGSDKQVLSNAYRAMTVNTQAKRGAFGWIYQTRW